LVTAAEAEKAACLAVAPDVVTLPALPDTLHELADPFSAVTDWLCGLEAQGYWRRGVGLTEPDASITTTSRQGKDA
jgi:hypothetical protein